MILILESIAACALFTLFVFLISRDPVKIVYNYPPAIIDRCRSLGLLDDFNRRGGTAFYVKKVTAMSFSECSWASCSGYHWGRRPRQSETPLTRP